MEVDETNFDMTEEAAFYQSLTWRSFKLGHLSLPFLHHLFHTLENRAVLTCTPLFKYPRLCVILCAERSTLTSQFDFSRNKCCMMFFVFGPHANEPLVKRL